MSFSDSIEDLSKLALHLADVAAQETLAHFRSHNLVADNKLTDAGFDPVTLADRGSERAMRAALAEHRPDDGVFGEEQARTYGRSGLTWVLDPIDGTRAFISGLPLWGTLIGLDDGNQCILGVIDQPYLQERYVGVVGDTPQARLLTPAGQKTLQARSGVLLPEATVFTTDPYLFDDLEMPVFEQLRSRARMTRYGTDCYAYALLALGMIDLVIESGLQAYDIAAHVPIVRAAGGTITDWNGGDCRWGGQVVAAGSAALHAEVLEILSTAAKPPVSDV